MGKVIAIDGPSGAGKSTIAKLIAREMGFDYLDTGALYRAVAFALRNNDIDGEDSDIKIMYVLKKTDIAFNNGRVFLNGKDVSEDIRSKEIDYYSSVFSARKIVRDFLLDAQRNAATTNNIVVEGRDTTTVLFPNAWKKIYLDASPDERAKRRYLQFKDKGAYANPEEAKRDVMERDIRDSNRDLAPLKRAENAFLLDSSDLSVEQAKEEILRFIKTGH
ncbi:MAG TPA: (d)CMP kinase [Thermodesulfovibrionales bacterium]|jgi:cytidylate kinase|nr:(d)CMP kinase [Thermodesulfovibrionales bacterium]